MHRSNLIKATTLIACLALGAWGQAPTNLTVKAATSKRVDLSWSGSASSYTVQRRPLGGAYASIATVTTTSVSDTAVDPYTTYQYTVVAGSSSSNEVTVGPPPAGFTVAAPAPGPPGTDAPGNYGYDLSLALDGNGDPAFAFISYDPNGDSDPSDSAVLFRSWNRAQYNWNPIISVGLVGDAATYFHNSLALAYDSSTNTFGIVSEKDDGSARLFVSTNGGSTWSQKATFAYGEDTVSATSLALANGNLYLAMLVDYEGLKYVTGKLSSDPSTWQSTIAPQPSGDDVPLGSTTISLALDSAGNPGIAYWVGDLTTGNSYNSILLYWRPAGSAAPVRVTDSENNQTSASVKLAYYKLNPRILFYAQRNDADFGVGDHFTRSDDGGNTWTQPIVIPPDGNSTTDFPFDMALDSQNHAVVSFGQNGGSGDAVCGNPKVSRSSDLVNWSTCAVTNDPLTLQFQPYPGAIQTAFGGNDKLYLVWWEDSGNPTGNGILMYREPPASAATGPVISSVVNAATFQPGIVAGSWISILGSNFSDVTRIWGDSDFNGNTLPTDLSGVEVKMNGLPASMYYISPTQLNVQAPAGISGTVSVQVSHNGALSNTLTAAAIPAAPGLFTYTGGTKTYPAAVFLSGTIVGDPSVVPGTQKARSGDRILLYATGLAPESAGSIVQTPVTVPGVTVTIGPANATVEYAGLVAVGEFQINIVVPSLADGDYPVTVQAGGQSSQSGVIISVTH